MRKIAYILMLLVATSMTAFAGNRKDEVKTIYAFGVTTSFSDPTVVFTEIQVLEGTLNKQDFLMNEPDYSRQLTIFLSDGKQETDYFSAIYYDTDLKKLKKEQNKLINKYMKKKKYTINRLPKTDFQFEKVEDTSEETAE